MREILTALAVRAHAEPHRIAILDRFGHVNYGELCRSVQHTAAWLRSLPDPVGLLAPKDRRSVVWHLALAWAGKTLVPLPEFFSPAQLTHLVEDAGVASVIAAPETFAAAQALGIPVYVPAPGAATMIKPAGGARWIIYTSGTTGTPKGVMLGERQIGASVRALAEASGANAEDRMLSVLPFALLLEQVAGIALPLSVGASIALVPDPRGLAAAAETFAATATVLVPEMLAGWVAWLEAQGRLAPETLRFVAVGGAPVPPRLAERAWAVGLPVHEGYGLSECCSVVAVNRPGERAGGTVGRPLSGVNVSIDAGEIVVRGPTVMEGYLGGPASGGVRRTGDAGRFDSEGRLVVEGRIDDVIVTSAGRNIHPEWIESLILGDARIARCAVIGGGLHPRAVLVPADSALAQAGRAELDALVMALTAEAPDYARPRGCMVMTEADLHRHSLLTANGRLRRRAIAACLEETA